MDRRFLTVLVVSLVFALVVSAMFYQFTSRGPSRPKAGPSDERDVVIAARALGVGATIKAADIKTVKIPAAALPKNGFTNPRDVLDRPVASPILADEPILEGRLAAKGSGVGLAPVIPVGMRAVAVKVNEVAGVSGFVLPGMRVDVLVTGHPPDNSGVYTTTCLQDILVLSAGTVIQPDAKGQAIPAPTVTLLVSPEQAETLTLASSEGRIQLVLRNGGDNAIAKTSGHDLRDLYGVRTVRTDAPPKKPRRIEAVAVHAGAPAPEQVIVIRGTKKSVETISLHAPEESR